MYPIIAHHTHTYALRITPSVPPVGENLSYEWERSCALAMLQTGIPIDVLMPLCTGRQACLRLDVLTCYPAQAHESLQEALAELQHRFTACGGQEWCSIEAVPIGRRFHPVMLGFVAALVLSFAVYLCASNLYPAVFYEETTGTARFTPYETLTFGEWAEKRDTTFFICTFRTAEGHLIHDTNRVTDVPKRYGEAVPFLYAPQNPHHYIIGSREENLAFLPAAFGGIGVLLVIVLGLAILPNVRFWWWRRKFEQNSSGHTTTSQSHPSRAGITDEKLR